MISRIHSKLGTASFIISVVALVAATTGAALAAGGLTKSQEKQVTKIAKKYAGKNGAPGAAGPAGPAGAAGKDGAAGKEGAQGPIGPQGPTGPQGKQGEPGEEGSPWTLGGVLPSEETETGVWYIVGGGSSIAHAPISFPIPLTAAFDGSQVHYSTEAGFSTSCKGNAANPTAEPGNLCVYQAAAETGMTFAEIDSPLTNEPGAARTGALIAFEVLANREAFGTFAVTAQ